MEQLYLSIVDARIYSSNSGYTLDTFLVQDANGGPILLSDEFTSRIQNTLIEQLSIDDNFQSVVQRRTPRQLKFFSIPTHASITHDIEKGYTILEVISADRPGLLATIGDIFIEYGIELINAKVSTLGERVEDIFFITNKDMQPINDSALCEKIQEDICQRLDAQIAENS